MKTHSALKDERTWKQLNQDVLTESAKVDEQDRIVSQLQQTHHSLLLKSNAAQQQIESDHQRIQKLKAQIQRENGEVERLASQKYQKILL